MKILVTGGSGLVGRYVVEALAAEHDVRSWDLRELRSSAVDHLRIDLLDEAVVARAMRAVDAVVHLAGIPHPLNDPPERVFRMNTQTTYNLLEASAAAGVPKFIFMSSESTLGFAFSTTRLWPLRLPVDETHPLRPQDPYGLSKVSCEVVCEGFSRRCAMRTICLRAPWIWVPEPKEIDFYRSLVREYSRWYKNLWAFIYVEDVVAAIRSALHRDLEKPHDRFFICADENWTGKPSRELAAEFYPESKEMDRSWNGSASFISHARATAALGFHPTGTVQSILN